MFPGRILTGMPPNGRVNVNLPITLARWALKFGGSNGQARFGDKEVKLGELAKFFGRERPRRNT